ncbi:ABC transporter permease [Schaalia sp. 19OD2882]|uniref:ABC transporter permease n=1 Tax=Schaalia sp. 19OD2882 TaxID=2794089 RepID=UPI001C1E95ED|nr:ABC transporter permease [Schaalia sp. 19OD2882]QWW19462.1 ABC transporter permease [Schaalia sp. 19OD2882]
MNAATEPVPPRSAAPDHARPHAQAAPPSRIVRGRRPWIEGQELVLIGVLLALWAAMGLLTPTFLEASNVFAIFYHVAPITIIGMAMTPIMCTAGIDVSVGASMAIVMVVIGRLVRDLGAGLALALVVALGVGALLGSLNALLIAIGRVPAMVCTFGTLNIFRFVALQIFGETQLAGVPGTLKGLGGSLADASFLGFPNAMWLALVLTALVWFYMRDWAAGRHVYAIGNDANAARLAGVKVRRRVFELYVFCGMMVGLAGVVSIGSGGLIQQNVGYGMEMSVIAACVIGGTSVIGGRGTVLGTLLGAVLVGSVEAAVIHLHLPNQLTQLFVGVIILVAVGVDLVRQARRARR